MREQRHMLFLHQLEVLLCAFELTLQCCQLSRASVRAHAQSNGRSMLTIYTNAVAKLLK